MIGRSGSMIGSGGAFASQASRGGKMRPKAVFVVVRSLAFLPAFFRSSDYRTALAHAQAALS